MAYAPQSWDTGDQVTAVELTDLSGAVVSASSGIADMAIDQSTSHLQVTLADGDTVDAGAVPAASDATVAPILQDTATASYAAAQSAAHAALDTTIAGKVAKGSLVINVKDYGAKGDGATDDTLAIQDAINAGGQTYFPPGVYVANGLVPASGMRLTGQSRSYPGQPGRAVLTATTGDLLAGPASAWVAMFSVDNLELQSQSGGGHIIAGMWSQGSFVNVGFRQYNDGKSVVNVTGWIDVKMSSVDVIHTTTNTAPTFYATSAAGNIAQATFDTCRFTSTWSAPAVSITGTAGSVPINISMTNVNFEGCAGGAIQLGSARNITLDTIGLWDFTTAATQNLISITKTGTNSPRSISISNVVRDASAAPAGGVMDIFVDPTAGVTDLNLTNNAHQTDQAFNVNAGNASGTISGSGMTVTNGSALSPLALVKSGTSAPTVGKHAAGELVVQSNAAAGSILGWLCTVGGDPGTWNEISAYVRVGSGQAVLSGGTVTVNNAAVTNGTTQIRVWLVTCSGTCGALYIAQKTSGVSFTIASTSAADNSTVAYEILRY